MPSVEEQLIEKGRREGLQKGREEGLRDALVRLLRARFGALDAPIEQRIAEGSTADVDRWMQQAIVAHCIDDVFEQ